MVFSSETFSTSPTHTCLKQMPSMKEHIRMPTNLRTFLHLSENDWRVDALTCYQSRVIKIKDGFHCAHSNSMRLKNR